MPWSCSRCPRANLGIHICAKRKQEELSNMLVAMEGGGQRLMTSTPINAVDTHIHTKRYAPECLAIYIPYQKSSRNYLNLHQHIHKHGKLFLSMSHTLKLNLISFLVFSRQNMNHPHMALNLSCCFRSL